MKETGEKPETGRLERERLEKGRRERGRRERENVPDPETENPHELLAHRAGG